MNGNCNGHSVQTAHSIEVEDHPRENQRHLDNSRKKQLMHDVNNPTSYQAQ